MRQAIVLIYFFFFSLLGFSQSFDENLLDSILFYRNSSKNSELDFEKRLSFIERAVKLSEDLNVDSTLLNTRRQLSNVYLSVLDDKSLLKVNRINLKLAEKLKDSTAIGYISNVLAWCHSEDLKVDSAYYYSYKASKAFRFAGLTKDEARALMSLGNIQFDAKDYLGAETNAVKSIRLMETLPKTEENYGILWTLFNLLGIVNDQLDLDDEAIQYHEKAIDFGKKISDDPSYELYSYSNIALIYVEEGKFDKAFEVYEMLFSNEEGLLKDPFNYALILGDYASAKFKSGRYPSDEISSMFTTAYTMSDSLDYKITTMAIGLNASEYYLGIDKKDSALMYANMVYKMADESKSNDAYLRSLLLKSKIEPSDKSKEYLTEYISMNDSLQDVERAVRNKFARIEYETDNLKERNKQISKERLWLFILSIGLILTLILLYIIVTQRAKNKELRLMQKQQEANEEIYNLMLSQQDKIDEARVIEKKRISQELHDGVLGRLFGTRLSLDSLNFSTNSDAIQTRGKYIESLKTIEDDIRKVSHELNTDFVSGSGFFSIIKTLVETQTSAYGFQFSLQNDDNIDWDLVSNKTKIHIYRIIQESLQNIYKHAKASLVQISFNKKKSVICMEIVDDGIGFDTEKAKKGIGLKNMTSRVNEFDGEFSVKSSQGSGTKLTILVPI